MPAGVFYDPELLQKWGKTWDQKENEYYYYNLCDETGQNACWSKEEAWMMEGLAPPPSVARA